MKKILRRMFFFGAWPYFTNVVFMNVLLADEILNFFTKSPVHQGRQFTHCLTCVLKNLPSFLLPYI